VALHVEIEETRDRCLLRCTIPCIAPSQTDAVAVTDETMRGVSQALAEHDATLNREYSDDEIRYVVSFPKARSDV